MLKKSTVGIEMYIVACLVMGVIVFVTITLAFNINWTSYLNKLKTTSRTVTGSEPDVRGAQYQCELRCSSIFRISKPEDLKKTSYCTYVANINNEPHRCYSSEIIGYECIVVINNMNYKITSSDCE